MTIQRQQPSRVVLVTGAGSGIGRAIATVLAREGFVVYAGMRDIGSRNRQRARELFDLASAEGLQLDVVEMDVLSEVSCRNALDQVLFERGCIDVVVNNAGMLMSGITEAFSPDQVATAIDTNALSWLRVNRAAVPARMFLSFRTDAARFASRSTPSTRESKNSTCCMTPNSGPSSPNWVWKTC